MKLSFLLVFTPSELTITLIEHVFSMHKVLGWTSQPKPFCKKSFIQFPDYSSPGTIIDKGDGTLNSGYPVEMLGCFQHFLTSGFRSRHTENDKAVVILWSLGVKLQQGWQEKGLPPGSIHSIIYSQPLTWRIWCWKSILKITFVVVLRFAGFALGE